ncbi:GMC family oxidoreductase [soil metagenome]
MHIDSRELPDNSVLETDICIIGAGPAGISIALEWLNSRHSVTLLEGGSYTVDNRMQDLYRGESVGQRYYPLEAARLHYFGGTSGHWGGMCSPLDPIDFKSRSWVPDSGWPISYEDIHPYFARAQQLLELPNGKFDLVEWMKKDVQLKPMPVNPDIVSHKLFQFSPPTRFGSRYRKEIEKSKNITLYTNANAVSIESNEDVSKITGVRTRNFEGKELLVKARYYILACGGIENARLLLCSNTQSEKGIGNYYDNVGRYFMEHLESQSGDLIMPQQGPMKLYLLDFYKTKLRAEFGLHEKEQENSEILNGTISLMPVNGKMGHLSNIDAFDKDAELNVKSWEEMDQWNARSLNFLTRHDALVKLKEIWMPIGKLMQSNQSQTFELFTRMEQSPNRESRVYLNQDRDELGMNRVTLDWRLSMLEKRSFRKLHECVGREIGRMGLGRIRMMDWLEDEVDESWPSILGGGWHHMGTTRMHDDPRKGVVDSNCKIHGLNNLFVAGSSCFTTSGAANPTLNLVALSIRLSDFLKMQMAENSL